VYVTAWHEEITRAGFDESGRCTQILNLARIGRGGDEHRVPARFGGPMHVCQKLCPITHGHRHIVVSRHGMRGLREVAVLTARRLRAIEMSLSWLDTGRANVAHAFSPESKSKARLRAPLYVPCSSFCQWPGQ